jgi:hypothetical protein
MNLNSKFFSKINVIFVFFIFFLLVPFSRLNHLNLMPGDLGDARLNNYFLENIYLFFKGQSDSLWHLGFFYPFPFIIGFSDNLFGSSLIYILFRVLKFKSDTAFQFWFLFGYLFNFIASYYSFRKLGGKPLDATIGALIFSFSLPTTAHASHSQLHYRFALPLALTFLVFFLKDKNPKNFVIFLSWLVWQLYCGIYMGFFTLLMSLVIIVSYLFIQYSKPNFSLNRLLIAFKKLFKNFSLMYFFLTALLMLMLYLLFYPYLQSQHLYGIKRGWSEINLMLPRLQSYFLSDYSRIWAIPNFKFFSQLPMRHEHQMFFGIIPILLAIYGSFNTGLSAGEKNKFILIGLLIPILFVLTLFKNGISLWFLLYKFPFFSAIRAVTRIDQAMLFPLGYLAMLGINKIETKKNGLKLIYFVIIPLILFECSFVGMSTSLKSEWRDRIVKIGNLLPGNIQKDKVVFFALRGGAFYADEIDVMWFSLINQLKTVNGYSGVSPPNYSSEYGEECSELPRRVLSYLKFSGNEGNIDKYHDLIKKIVPIGFVGCDSNWFFRPPKISVSYKEYIAEDFKKLFFKYNGKYYYNNKFFLKVDIQNLGDSSIFAQSGIGKPVRVAWRYLNKSNPTSEWFRLELPSDIDTKNKISLNIPVDSMYEKNSDELEVTMVQELVFWANEVGMQSLKVNIK